jgi:hypothetical protein
MRTLLTITLTCFLSLSTFAQDHVDLKEMVGFACYYEGRSTRTVVKVSQLLKAKNYRAISKLISSGNNGEKYLAVIALQRLADQGQYQLSDSEKGLIAKAKPSDDMVSVCSGCTYFEKIPMKTVLREENFIGSENWLDRIIKKENTAP